ncbi:MAG TPA: hypothetical protein VIJ88_01680, partial [Candidatus Paceibacterota bacterium]
MRGRGHQGKSFLILLFVIIFAFWWGVSVIAQNEQGPLATLSSAPPVYLPAAVPQNVPGPVAVLVTQKGTVYTYSGSLPLPSSCDELGTGIAVNGTNPAHVTLLLILSKPLTACAEAAGGVIEEPFSASLSVKPGTKVVFDGLTVNGVIVTT